VIECFCFEGMRATYQDSHQASHDGAQHEIIVFRLPSVLAYALSEMNSLERLMVLVARRPELIKRSLCGSKAAFLGKTLLVLRAT